MASDEVERLRRENQRLGEQVKLLVRMERRLGRTSRQLEQQVRQVTALNEFSLQAADAGSVDEVVAGALEVLLELYPLHRAVAVTNCGSEEGSTRIDCRPRAGIDCRETIAWSDDGIPTERLGTEPLFVERSEIEEADEFGDLRGELDAMVPEEGYDEWYRGLVLPLTHPERETFGCVWAIACTESSTTHDIEFGEQERSMIEIFRRHLVSAIDNTYLRSRLEERVQQRTSELTRALDDLEETHEQLQHEMADRIEAERTLARVQKLESMGQLTASLGHEINNPLTYLLSNLEFLSRRLRDGESVDETLLEALDEAIEGGERIAQLVRDIKAFTGHDDISLGPVDLADLLGEAIKLVRNQVRHVAELNCRVGDDLPSVHGQEGPLQQVLVNLVMNAVEAIPIDGDAGDHEIRIEGRRLDERAVELTVSDTGCGIPADELEKVFDPFFSTKVSEGGTGLGLFVCHSLVDSMNGTLTLDSTPGEGTTARLILPVAEAGAGDQTDRTESEVRRDDEGLDILVVDDEEPILRVFSRLLSAHRVATAAGGREALEVYRSRNFDVVICDLMMPGMSGRELFRKLESKGEDHARRVVFITGGAFSGADREFLADLSNPCIQKPINREKLEEVVARIGAGA